MPVDDMIFNEMGFFVCLKVNIYYLLWPRIDSSTYCDHIQRETSIFIYRIYLQRKGVLKIHNLVLNYFMDAKYRIISFLLIHLLWGEAETHDLTKISNFLILCHLKASQTKEFISKGQICFMKKYFEKVKIFFYEMVK